MPSACTASWSHPRCGSPTATVRASFGHSGSPAGRAWAFWQEEARSVAEVPSGLLADLVGALGHPRGLEWLRSVYEQTRPDKRSIQGVAAAFVHAFAEAGAPEAAEVCLGGALGATQDPDAREALVWVCREAYRRAGRRGGFKRIGRTAEVLEIDLPPRPGAVMVPRGA